MQTKLESYDHTIHSGVSSALKQLNTAREQLRMARETAEAAARLAAADASANGTVITSEVPPTQTFEFRAPAIVISPPSDSEPTAAAAPKPLPPPPPPPPPVPETTPALALAIPLEQSLGSYQNVTSALLDPNRSQSPLITTVSGRSPAPDQPTVPVRTSPNESLFAATLTRIDAAAGTIADAQHTASEQPATEQKLLPPSTQPIAPVPLAPVPTAAAATATAAGASTTPLIARLERECIDIQLQFDAIARLATPLILLSNDLDPQKLVAARQARITSQPTAAPAPAAPAATASGGDTKQAPTAAVYSRLASLDAESLIRHLSELRNESLTRKHQFASSAVGGTGVSDSIADLSETESFASESAVSLDAAGPAGPPPVPVPSYEAVLEGCIALQVALTDANARITSLEREHQTHTFRSFQPNASAGEAGATGLSIKVAPVPESSDELRTAALRKRHASISAKLKFAIDKTQKLHAVRTAHETARTHSLTYDILCWSADESIFGGAADSIGGA